VLVHLKTRTVASAGYVEIDFEYIDGNDLETVGDVERVPQDIGVKRV